MGRTLRKRQKKKRDILKLNENTDKFLFYLRSWLLNEKCLSICHLIPEYFPFTGRGLKTLKHIENDEILIQLPFEMLITTDTLLHCNIKTLFLNNTVDSFDPQCVLAVFLAYEVHLGTSSKWHFYLKTLPQSFTNPDFCSNREKKLLPSFILDSLHQAHELEKNFSLIMKSIKHLEIINRAYCPHCNAQLQNIITFAKYKWAYYVVNTRAVYIDNELCKKNIFNMKEPNNLALAPFLDLFNHDVNADVKVSVVTDNLQNQFYQIVTLKSFDKDSQVFINYGPHSNLKLYIDYGFFIPCNPLDEIHFDIFDIQKCFNISGNKLDFITFNNFHKNMSFTRSGLNYNATMTLFILNTKLEKNYWKIKIYGEMFDSDERSMINKLGINILNVKRMEYTCALSNMKNAKFKSQSFSIAINLVEEYINILDMAFNYMGKNRKS